MTLAEKAGNQAAWMDLIAGWVNTWNIMEQEAPEELEWWKKHWQVEDRMEVKLRQILQFKDHYMRQWMEERYGE